MTDSNLMLLPALDLVLVDNSTYDLDTFINIVSFKTSAHKAMARRALAKRFGKDLESRPDERLAILNSLRSLLDGSALSSVSLETRRTLAAAMSLKIASWSRVAPCSQKTVEPALIEYLFLRYFPGQLMQLVTANLMKEASSFNASKINPIFPADFFLSLELADTAKTDVADYFLQNLIDAHWSARKQRLSDKKIANCLNNNSVKSYRFSCVHPLTLLETLKHLNYPDLPLILLPRRAYEQILLELEDHPYLEIFRPLDEVSDIRRYKNLASGRTMLVPGSFKRRHSIKHQKPMPDEPINYDHWMLLTESTDQSIGFFCIYEKHCLLSNNEFMKAIAV